MRSERRDFTQRADLLEWPEWMDEPCSYEVFRGLLRDLERVNRSVLAYRPTLQWIDRCMQTHRKANAGAALNIVDVGCGGGDMLRRIASWAARESLPVHLTGIDLNPHAGRAAEEFSGGRYAIEWITGDVFSYAPAGPVHCVLSSLFTHHLSNRSLVRFIGWMEDIATWGWFINDLKREATAYYGFKVLATLMRWHPYVRHDGPVSIQRSFQPEDWHELCRAAGIKAEDISVEDAFPARLCVSRVKHA